METENTTLDNSDILGNVWYHNSDEEYSILF